MKISMIDYGACNISSVYSAFENLGADIKVITKLKDIEKSEKIVIPGVGAAKSSIDYLKSNNLFEPLKNFISSGKPILGICLGFQMFSIKLHENGISDGLGFFDADVINFSKKKNIFHIGWNTVNIDEQSQKFFKIKNLSSFYFCHSYFLKFNKSIKSTKFIGGLSKFKINFPSIIIKNNIIGVQFHPEKSQSNGAKILEKFINWTP